MGTTVEKNFNVGWGGRLWVAMLCRGTVLVGTKAKLLFSTNRGAYHTTSWGRGASGWSCEPGFL